jgi:hypothetical protein
MTTPSDNTNTNTSYKPFAQSNYNNNEDEVYSRSLSEINEEIIRRTTLLQLKEKLFDLPHNAQSSLVYAQQVTDIVDDDHLLGFLYVENYNVDVSVSFRRACVVGCIGSFYYCNSLIITHCFIYCPTIIYTACTNKIATILE